MTQQSHSLGIYPEETKIEKDTCTPRFTAALFTIVRTWKQPRCPSTDEDKKVIHIHNGILLSHKKNIFESVLMRWMNLELVIQSEVSQKQKDKYCILMHMYGIQKKGTEEFIYRAALLGRKVMTNLNSILKSRDITLPTKVCLVKAMVFPVFMYGCESWTVKKAEC